jgi:DNA primase
MWYPDCLRMPSMHARPNPESLIPSPEAMSQIDQVRTAADIVKIVGDYVKLRKAGANYVGLCPFHQEKTPSFAVHPVKQIFHCFGCGVGGDVFKFVMLIENLPFPEALRRVAEKVGVHLAETPSDATYDANSKLRAALLKIHAVAANFFAAQLGGTAEGRVARAYLADRGMTDEVVGRFRLGYAPGDGQGLTRQLTGAGFEKEALEKSGAVLFDPERQRLYDRFRRRVIFPIANESGKVVAFAGRALGDEQPKYLNSPETPIYTKSRLLYNLDRAGQAVRKLDYAILVEGYMDCITVAASGVENVVASCGTSLTEGQVRLLARYSRRVVVNYDPDSAGMAATERSLALLLEGGFEAKVLALPKGLDPDAFIRKQGAAAYRELLAKAPTYLDYLTDRAVATHDVGTPEGKVAAANTVLPYLVKVPNPMLRAELAGRLAERLRLDERLLRDELRRAAGEGRGEVRVREDVSADANHAVKQLLRACLESEEVADALLPELVESGAVAGLFGEGVFRRISEARRRGERLQITEAEELLEPPERRLAYDALFWPGEPPNLEQARGYLRALELQRVQRERDKLLRDIEAAARAQDSARLADLQRSKSNLDKELRRFNHP